MVVENEDWWRDPSLIMTSPAAEMQTKTNDLASPEKPTFMQSALSKMRKEPFIPIGIVLTVGALYMAGQSMVKRDSRNMNLWLRARVAAQGATVVAFCVYGLSARNARDGVAGYKDESLAEATQRL